MSDAAENSSQTELQIQQSKQHFPLSALAQLDHFNHTVKMIFRVLA